MSRSNHYQKKTFHVIRREVRRWLTREEGNVLPIAALGMTVLLGFMGLALDFGYLYRHKRIMQTAADAGAMAGASEVYRNKASLVAGSSLGATASNGFTNGSAGVSVTVNNGPASGYYQGNQQYVEVIITQNAPSHFIQVFGITSTLVRARAVAGVGARSANCIYALDPAEEKALTVTSQSRVTASCGIVDNSRAYNAFNIESGSNVAATSISVTGGSNVTSGSGVSPTPMTSVPPEPDPLGYLQPPAFNGCTYNGQVKVSSGTFTLNPGTYCGGIEIASGSTVTFNPGLYYIKDDGDKGGFLVASGSSVKGTGVTFFNTGGEKYRPIEIMSGSSADLAAPTSGPWANILFYQDRNAGKPGDKYMNLIQSNIVAKFKGIMYFPTQILGLATSNSTVTVTGSIIARTILVESGSNVIVHGDGSGQPGNSPLKRLSLVE
jgi:hypothetical protein